MLNRGWIGLISTRGARPTAATAATATICVQTLSIALCKNLRKHAVCVYAIAFLAFNRIVSILHGPECIEFITTICAGIFVYRHNVSPVMILLI